MPDISKVILNGVTQMDVTQDTVAPGNLLLNETATMNNGTRTVGTVDLSTYAPLNSPTFTGTPKAPTAAAGTKTTQIATTSFVQGELSAHGLDADGVQISSTNDLNSITTTGWYYWLTSVPANSPTTYTYGSMYVDHAGSNVKQTVFRKDKEYTRVKYSTNAWSAWHEVNTTSLATDLILYADATNGDDSNDGLTTTTPLKTINAAVAKIPKDTAGRVATIYLANGTYAAATISFFNGVTILVTKESSATAASIIIQGATISDNGHSTINFSNVTFNANVTANMHHRIAHGIFASCVFDGASLYARGNNRITDCTFRNISTSPAITVEYGTANIHALTIENTVVSRGVYASRCGIASVSTYNLANNATTPYAAAYSGRIFVGGRTYKESTGVENIYYTSTPFSVTGDQSITLTGDMQNYSTIILYLTTSSTNTSGNRCMVRFTPWELSAAPEYVLSTNGTNFYGVRLGLVTNNVYTQLRFISTTAPNLYIVQAAGVI